MSLPLTDRAVLDALAADLAAADYTTDGVAGLLGADLPPLGFRLVVGARLARSFDYWPGGATSCGVASRISSPTGAPSTVTVSVMSSQSPPLTRNLPE